MPSYLGGVDEHLPPAGDLQLLLQRLGPGYRYSRVRMYLCNSNVGSPPYEQGITIIRVLVHSIWNYSLKSAVFKVSCRGSHTRIRAACPSLKDLCSCETRWEQHPSHSTETRLDLVFSATCFLGTHSLARRYYYTYIRTSVTRQMIPGEYVFGEKSKSCCNNACFDLMFFLLAKPAMIAIH